MLAIELFDRGVQRFPERVLVADAERSYTYAQMHALSLQVARALIGAGIRPDDPVALLSVNHPLVLACQYGLVRAGALWTPCNYRNTAEANAKQLAIYGARFIFFHSQQADQLATIRAAVPGIVGAVCIDKALPDAPALEDWAAQADGSLPFPGRKPADGVAILSSSGTTGEPKGAFQPNRAFEALAASYYAVLPTQEPPVHLVVAPLTHAAGVVHWAFLPRGATNIIAPSADPGLILQMIEKHKVSILFLPPTVIYMLLAHPDIRKYDYSSLRYFLYGAAPMSVTKLREAMEVFGPVMTQNYGQTEALMIMTVLTPAEHSELLTNPRAAKRILSAGREGPFARVEIMDDDCNFLPAGTPGEVVYQSQLVMTGYYKNPKATAEVSAGGWHHSGDVGYKDEDGFVYIVDRKRDMIISGGFNIFPAEVEQAALAHPAVQDCAVVGAPDDKWGEIVIATVELKPGATFDKDEFLAFCKTKLGSVKAPKRVDVWETLPRSTVGKTLRRVVRDTFWVGRERKI